MRRKYKSGTRWCVWRWTDVDSEYITRLHLVKTPWFAICLHWIHKPDPEPYLHDHPVTFLSCIICGGYSELRRRPRSKTGRVYQEDHRWFNFVRGCYHDQHSIFSVKPHTVTLCFMGPKTREWGFHTPDGWVYWKDYYARKRANQDGQGMDSVRREQAPSGGTVSHKERRFFGNWF